MKSKYTVEELRSVGCETVGRYVVFGAGPLRRQVRIVGEQVDLSLADFAVEVAPSVLLGAALAELDAPKKAPNIAKAVKVNSPGKNAALGLPDQT